MSPGGWANCPQRRPIILEAAAAAAAAAGGGISEASGTFLFNREFQKQPLLGAPEGISQSSLPIPGPSMLLFHS